jgi:ABC-type oligopeptide transport system substrate-binding subunit
MMFKGYTDSRKLGLTTIIAFIVIGLILTVSVSYAQGSDKDQIRGLVEDDFDGIGWPPGSYLDPVIASDEEEPGEDGGEIEGLNPKTLYLNHGPADPNLDPGYGSPQSSPDMFIARQLFIGLFRRDEETGKPIPELAKSWSMTPNAKKFTFKLHSGVKWTDGKPVTAYDVRYAILRNLAPATGSDFAYILSVIENASEYHDGTITDPNLVGVKALDSTTVQFTLEESAAYFPSILATPIAWPLPAWAISAHPSDWTEPGNIVTNGPYRMKTWIHGSKLVLTKNPKYFKASKVKIQVVQFSMLDEASAWTRYQNGKLDSVYVPESEWSGAPPSELSKATRFCTYYYGFNTSKAPFDELLVRKAFIAAADRQGVVDYVLGYAQKPALTYTAPGIFGHVDGVTEGVGIPYNPTKAKKWLSDAGYPNGVGLPPITLMYNTSIGHENIAKHIKENWQDNLNVSVILEEMAWNDYLEQLETDPPQIWRLGWCGDLYDAHNFVSDAIRPAYFGGWSNTTYDNLIYQVRRNPIADKRLTKYKQIEKILVQTDAIMMPIYYYAFGWATKPYLERGYGDGGYGGHIDDWKLLLVPPTNVKASNGTSTTQVNVSWDASPVASEYKVYRASSATGTKTLLTTTAGLTYADTTATPGKRYFYWVKACYAIRCSGLSAYDTGWTKLMVTYTSIASHDGWVLERRETSGKGGKKDSIQTTLRVGDDRFDRQYCSILSFDSAALPDNAVVTFAQLQVRRVTTVGSDPFGTHGRLWVAIRTGPFSGDPALESSDFQAPASAVKVAHVVRIGTTSWYKAKLNPAGRVRINRVGVTQFRLCFALDDNDDMGNDFVRFLSSDVSHPAKRPSLRVSYYVP